MANQEMLSEAKAETEAQVVASLRGLSEAKEKLFALRAKGKTDANPEYLKAAKKAWRASIKAYELSIVAFRKDIVSYDREIDAIINRVPEARQDN